MHSHDAQARCPHMSYIFTFSVLPCEQVYFCFDSLSMRTACAAAAHTTNILPNCRNKRGKQTVIMYDTQKRV